MRIAHIVTYVSPDGAFGGPARVALGQAEALADRNHEVTVFAAAPRNSARTKSENGYLLKTYPAQRLAPVDGFAFMASYAMTRSLYRELQSFDAVHIHLARDLVTMPAALLASRMKIPYVLQTHGMIDASKKLLSRPLDFIATRPVLTRASAVLTLTDREDEEIATIAPTANTVRIANGIKVVPVPRYENRANIVLFLARLHSRKRPIAFVRMAELLKTELHDTRFIIAGPDEGEGAAVKSAIERAGMGPRLEWIGSVSPEETDELFANARAYVLPAFDEVFPMTILEALSAGTPVITTESLGIAGACLRFGAAKLTDGSPQSLAAALREVMSSNEVAERLRDGGQNYLKTDLNVSNVAATLESLYLQGSGNPQSVS